VKNLFHSLPALHSVDLGKTDPLASLSTTVVVRRKLGHDEIPGPEEFINCPPRERLSEEEFAQRYGASTEDIEAVKSHYQSYGITVVEEHLARRHVYLEGTVSQFNSAFGIEIKNYEKLHGKNLIKFHSHETPALIPDHLTEVVMGVMHLENQPHALPPAFFPPVTTTLSLSTTMAIYNSPTNTALKQTIGIGRFSGWGNWTLADLTSTCESWGVPFIPATQSIVISPISPGTDPEATLDVTMCALFGNGANLTIYDSTDLRAIVSRAVHPNSNEAACNILSFSFSASELNFDPALDTVFQDAAIQGVTIFASSGDWGITNALGTAVALWPAVNPYVTGVGGTTLGANSGLVSSSNFVEYAWNEANAYYFVTGGGVSVNDAKPSFQNSVTIPATLTTVSTGKLNGAAGRGVPDISANASPEAGVLYYYTGTQIASAGTSASAPMMAGMFARINAALGRNVGWINPTLYASGNTAFIRKLSAGGPVNNTMINTPTGLNAGVTFAGYPTSTTGWNACVGLGMVNGGNFLSYVQANGLVSPPIPPIAPPAPPAVTSTNYYIKVVAVNAAGPGPDSSIYGPFTVPQK
jgi:kumamolisin